MGWLTKIFGALSPRSDWPPGKSPAELLSAGGVLIDVRSKAEFAAGHIEGALWLPLDRIQREIAAAVPDRDRTLILYCRSGARSGRARSAIARLGYHNALNGGGIRSLAAALGRPITKPRR